MVLSAAVRELFEEAGVLLAGPDGTDVVHDVRGDDWQADADLLAAHELSLSELLTRRSLVLRSDLLGLCSRWLTPAFEPRRYDTWFLAATVPDGQEPRSRTTEAVDGRWVRPVEVLHAASGGFVTLLPPTAYNIGLLAEARDARQFVTAERPADQLTFTPTPGPDGSTVLSCRLPAPATPPARTS